MVVLFSCSTKQQVQNISQEKVDYLIEVPVRFATIDALGNIYVVTRKNEIMRYTKVDGQFELQYKFSNYSQGIVQSIDVANPKKIIAFIRDFSRIILLDNTLAEIQTIDLNTSEFQYISAVARTNDNQIWVFDNVNQTLVKINEIGLRTFESNRLSDYGLDNVDPFFIKERTNKVVLNDRSIGLIVFDNFGQYIYTIPEKNTSSFDIQKNRILSLKNNEIVSHPFQPDFDTERQQIDSPNAVQQILIGPKSTFLVFSEGILAEK